jgi:hypothetical protein
MYNELKYLSPTELQTLIGNGYVMAEPGEPNTPLTQEEIDLTLSNRGYNESEHDLLYIDEPLRGYKAKPVVVTPKPLIDILNIQIPAAELNGSIYWVKKDSPVVVTANCAMPDGELMTMVEKVIDGSVTVDDFRVKAVIVGGVMTMSFVFDTSGNYIFRKSRLNEGLDRIGAAFNLNFEDVEFDVYVEYP